MGGRMPYSDGNQAKITDPALRFLVNKRIKERLLGTFDYTMVGRSFDGGKIQVTAPALTLTGPNSEWLPRSTGRLFWFL
ncbi:MAG: hypothetical protein P8R42_09395 [Candidatus Binatia bacterium]|nr:hypothetical protein [Candidatus Binatia bacterium]